MQFKAKIKDVDHFCSSSIDVRFWRRSSSDLFNGPKRPIGIVNKVVFLVVTFRSVTLKDKPKSWIGAQCHLCKRIREIQGRVSSYSW